MECDKDLILKILEWRASVPMAGPIPVPKFDGWTRAEVAYHLVLCDEARFLKLGMEAGTLMWNGEQALLHRLLADRLEKNAGSAAA